MLSYLVLGAFWDSFELFGSLWGLPWESLGPFSGILGSLLGLLGLAGPLLGCTFGLSRLLLDSLGRLLGLPYDPLGPRGGKAARCPKTAPKVAQETPNGAKTLPQKSVSVVSFLGSVFESSSGLLLGRVLGQLAP